MEEAGTQPANEEGLQSTDEEGLKSANEEEQGGVLHSGRVALQGEKPKARATPRGAQVIGETKRPKP